MARRKRVEASNSNKKTKYEPILAENDNIFSGDICLEIMKYLTGEEIFFSCLRINRTWFNNALDRFDHYHFKAKDYEKATNLLRTIRRNNYSKLYYATMKESVGVRRETPKLLAEKIKVLDLNWSQLDDRRATLLLDVLDMTKNLKVLKVLGTSFSGTKLEQIVCKALGAPDTRKISKEQVSTYTSSYTIYKFNNNGRKVHCFPYFD